MKMDFLDKQTGEIIPFSEDTQHLALDTERYTTVPRVKELEWDIVGTDFAAENGLFHIFDLDEHYKLCSDIPPYKTRAFVSLEAAKRKANKLFREFIYESIEQ